MDCFCISELLTVAFVGVFSICLFLKYLGSRKVANFSKRYVLITGCDSGFGKMAVVRLDQLGFHVFAGCLTEEGERELQSVCSERVVTLQLDVTDYSQIQQAYTKVCSHLPKDAGLWGLINNAGVFSPGYIDWHSREAYRKVADINIWGLVDVTVAFLPLIKKACGRIVNTSSIAGIVALPGFGPYCITKYGVEGFSDVLRREIGLWDVLVSIVEPGAHRNNIIAGDFLNASIEKTWNGAPSDVRKAYGEDFFLKAKDGFYQWGENSNTATYAVVDAYIDAVTSQWPRARYLVGADAKLLVFINRFPEFIADWAMRRIAFQPTKVTSKND